MKRILILLLLLLACRQDITVTGEIFLLRTKTGWDSGDQTYIKTLDGKIYDFNGIHGEVGDTITVTLYKHQHYWVVVRGPVQ